METRNGKQLAGPERRHRRLLWLSTAQAVALGAVIIWLLSGSAGWTSAGAEQNLKTLRVEELVVVDGNGVVRVRIGGKLPDAVRDGKPIPRGEDAAGILLYDDTGRERSGYVTWEPSGNVGLTLDTRDQQVALFAAGPDGGSALQLWDGKDLVELRSDSDGSRFTAVKEGRVVLQEPPVRMREEVCAAYRDARKRFSPEKVLEACRRRFRDEACRACLDAR